PFADKSFDVSISSFVAHGLSKNERLIMYDEMKRITKHLVIIYDYNEHRGLITDIAEWLEGGDYFNFIKTIKNELNKKFIDVTIIHANIRSALYIAKL
ncbi:MAG TPA: class I SAM-dependent methyltransferase, partial [Clostridiales bacterium]|nr:class I SAM-dependent methyltransferase [Clostridiales bacterium]